MRRKVLAAARSGLSNRLIVMGQLHFTYWLGNRPLNGRRRLVVPARARYTNGMSSTNVSRRHLLRVVAGWGGVASTAWLSRLAWAAGSEPLAELRAGGLAVLMRHAHTTVGSGDPPGYRLDDCATQRNLDEAGRAQAQRVGQWFAKNGFTPARVRNSPWCRARDTARLAFGRSEDWAALGNIFDRELQPSHVAEVRSFVTQLRPGELAVLISHGVTIGALAGAHPAPAEGVLVRARPGEPLRVVGHLAVA